MKLNKLFHDYVIVKVSTEEKTSSGLYIPIETQETKQLKGEIIYIGKDVDDEDLKIGSIVLFDKLNSSPSPTNEKDELICQYDDIIALL